MCVHGCMGLGTAATAATTRNKYKPAYGLLEGWTVYLSIYLSTYLPAYLSIYLPTYLSS